MSLFGTLYLDKSELLDLINKFDEMATDTNVGHEKPVIPQFVADWIEDHKKSYTRWGVNDRGDFVIRCSNDLFRFGEGISSYDFSIDDKISKYSLENPYDFIKAILDGYEIEKEKLYTIKLKDGRQLVKVAGTAYTEFANYPDKSDILGLTQSEIESVDLIFMQIAVEVTE